MKFAIRYRKNSKRIDLRDSHEITIDAVANDWSSQLARRYKAYCDKNTISITEIQLARYRVGQKWLIIAALESMR